MPPRDALEDAVLHERIRRLEAAHEGALLAQALGAVLTLAHAHPIARALEVRQRRVRVELRPPVVGARAKPGDARGVTLNERVHDLGSPELRHDGRQQVFHEGAHDLLIGEGVDGAGVVEVAGHDRPLRLLATPELPLRLGVLPLEARSGVPASLQLVEHEERAARAAELVEAAEDVGRILHGHVLVEPQPRRADVDGPAAGRVSEGVAAAEPRAAPHHGLHAVGAEREHHGVEVLELARGAVLPRELDAGDAALGRSAVVGRRDLIHDDLLHAAAAEHLEVAGFEEALREGLDERRGHGAALDPAHVEGVLVRERVVVEKLHDDGGAQLLRRLEESHEQRRLEEVVHEPFAHAEANEELVRRHAVVLLEGRLVTVVVEHGEQQPHDGGAILDGQALEVVEGREDLAQRRRQRRELRRREDRRRRLEALRAEEARARELREHLALGHAEAAEHALDVGVVLPEPALPGVERLA
mmetsp:Transcript_43754/g.137383  ORF Transcript_43754/g.137383 Transcript_43754/m.137383 type:complete len:473 (+) Transcript_43754:485-1903(+)